MSLWVDGRHVGRRHIIGPRSVDTHALGERWQKTKITSKKPVIGSGNSAWTAQENREDVFYRGSGDMERATRFDSLNTSDELN